ncbi:MAG: hypothetical protein ACKVU4_05025 [Phycisphaerales bacterium]
MNEDRRGRAHRVWRSRAWTLACAAAVFALTAALLRSMEARATDGRAIRDHLDERGQLRPIAEVAAAVRAMKLVTVEIDTSATASRSHESWRGGVSANVKAPVRLLFGTDLSALNVDAIAISPLARAYLVRVPTPTRLATEVDGGREEASVHVGWGRFRTRAGEYWLGQARRGLSDEARRLGLSPEHAEEVRRTSREQVAALFRKIVGPNATVHVVFTDEAATAVAGAGEKP